MLRWITAALFILAVPVFLLLSNVRVAALEQRVYGYSFSQYDVEAVTGIDRAQLDRAAAEMIQYFKDDEPLLTTRVRLDGEEQPLFSAKETLHMRDVKKLFQQAFFLQEVAFVYIVGYVVTVFLWARERSMLRLAEQSLYAGVFTAGLLAVAAVAMLAGFDSLFRQFHLVSFSNDFWELDPAVDHLVQMFPQGFWFRVSFLVGVVTVAQGLAVAGAAYMMLRWLRQPEPAGTRGRRPAAEPAAGSPS
ncbi:MAG: TIGR01906 family membrane protein [Dehalococcoidia bacterium]